MAQEAGYISKDTENMEYYSPRKCENEVDSRPRNVKIDLRKLYGDHMIRACLNAFFQKLAQRPYSKYSKLLIITGENISISFLLP